jgi:hypothetical protein
MPGPVFDCRAWGIGGLRNGRERDGGGAKALPTPSACFRAAPPTIPFPRTSNGDTFAAMPGYRRRRIPGGTYFFTVALRDRRAEWLVTEVEELRAAVRATRTRHPFTSMPRWCCRTTCTARGRCPRGRQRISQAVDDDQGGILKVESTFCRSSAFAGAQTRARRRATSLVGTAYSR